MSWLRHAVKHGRDKHTNADLKCFPFLTRHSITAGGVPARPLSSHYFRDRPHTSKLVVHPLSRGGQALQSVPVGERRKVLLVLMLPLRHQFLPLHEGVVELLVRVGENHFVVELGDYRLRRGMAWPRNSELSDEI